MRALAVARNCMPGLERVQWHFLDDAADAVRGADVARQMIDWKADPSSVISLRMQPSLPRHCIDTPVLPC